MARPIGSLGVIPTLTIGDRVFTDLDNLIILGSTSSVAGRNSVFRKLNVTGPITAGYQVPAAVSFRVDAFRYDISYNGFTNSGTIFYTDNDIGVESAGSGTNPKYLYDNAVALQMFYSPTVESRFFYPGWKIPTTKYLNGIFVQPGTIQAFGYEV